MEFVEFKGKTKDEALMQASVELGVPSTDLEYEVISEETKGFLGIGSKPCIIKARKKKTLLKSGSSCRGGWGYKTNYIQLGT